MQTHVIQYIIIALYFGFILVKGLLYSRKIRHQDDFLVAGRNIGGFFLLCTVGATVIGGGSSIGAIGKTYEWGILMLLVSTGWYLQFIFSGIFVAPRFRELRLYTVAGYFGKRFDENNRFLAFVLSMLFSIGVLGAQLVAFGKIITSMIAEIPYIWAVVIGSSIVILYSTAGGLKAVIHTDVFQFIILIAGFLLTLGLCIPELMANRDKLISSIPPNFFKLDGGKGWLFAITTFFAFMLGETFAPGYATRFVAGKSSKDTRKGIVGAGLFLTLTFPLILFIIALYARLNFPSIDNDQVLPVTILRLNNPVIGGLILAALMSAVMSSADSILNSATAIFVKDLYEHYFQKGKPEKQMHGLKISRYFSVIIGVSGVILAIILPDIIDLLLLTYTVWAPGIAVPVIVGIFTRKKSTAFNRLVLITSLTGIFVTLMLKLSGNKLIEQPAVVGVLCSALVYLTGIPIIHLTKRISG
jgi:SSS family solute:Na+ symporter